MDVCRKDNLNSSDNHLFVFYLLCSIYIQGTQFTSQLYKILCQTFNKDHVMSTSYNYQAYGKVKDSITFYRVH